VSSNFLIIDNQLTCNSYIIVPAFLAEKWHVACLSHVRVHNLGRSVGRSMSIRGLGPGIEIAKLLLILGNEWKLVEDSLAGQLIADDC
jgi:hypothetical protein